MTTEHRRLIYGALILLIIVLVASWAYCKYYVVKLDVLGLSVQTDGSVRLAAAVAGSTKIKEFSESAWAGARIKVYTKSLGELSSLVVGVIPPAIGGHTIGIATEPGAYVGTGVYAFDKGDHLRIIRPMKK
ncbi:MAG: hypothetical protein WC052_04545 [Patescibacteria group bacterium]